LWGVRGLAVLVLLWVGHDALGHVVTVCVHVGRVDVN
jgi:hypothetical protein